VFDCWCKPSQCLPWTFVIVVGFKSNWAFNSLTVSAIIWYLTNTPLNDKFEEFIDGFLNCMNADPTF